MATILIIGDGPAGLSAALFLAKNGHEVTVLGKNETAMHDALLLNYLGIEKVKGTEFQQTARRQVANVGGMLRDAKVVSARASDGGFEVEAEDGGKHQAEYLIVTAGPKTELADGLGLELDDKGYVKADRNGRTNVPKLYVGGWSTRRDKIQAIVSAGDGAAAALDILSTVKGKEFHDFDTP